MKAGLEREKEREIEVYHRTYLKSWGVPCLPYLKGNWSRGFVFLPAIGSQVVG